MFLPRRRPNGSWYVEITWPNGRKESLGNFHTSADAEDVIKSQLQAWRDGRERFQGKPIRAD
jgi:hypothetical protein